MRPGSSDLTRFAPTRARPAYGLGEMTMPQDWRLTPDEQDGPLTATDFGGSVLTVQKSRLYALTEFQVLADPDLKAYFFDEWKKRRSLLLSRGDPAWMTVPKISAPPLPLGMREVERGYATKRRFILGSCPAKDAMQWGMLVPDGVQQTACVIAHVLIGAAALVTVMGAVWAMNQAGRAAGGG